MHGFELLTRDGIMLTSPTGTANALPFDPVQILARLLRKSLQTRYNYAKHFIFVRALRYVKGLSNFLEF